MTLIGGIAHDVRTFATRLRLRVEKIPDAAERERAIADIDDMIRLLDDALLSSRVGAGQLSQEMVDFAALVQAEADDRRVQGSRVELSANQAARDVIVLGDRLALRRMVANIIDNAIKYGGVARLRVELENETIVLTVDDEGPGIPADQRKAMLEPFNRLETSRNRATGGAGLGLAVARSVAESHDGTIEIAEAPGGGTRVRIGLPVFRPAPDERFSILPEHDRRHPAGHQRHEGGDESVGEAVLVRGGGDELLEADLDDLERGLRAASPARRRRTA